MKIAALLALALACAAQDRTYPPVKGALNPAVTQATIHATICVRGYTRTIRNVSAKTSKAIYARDGVVKKKGVCCEVDHLISLELGGSNNPANLWAEPYEPRPGAHEKDRVENFLNARVCSGVLTLAEAQRRIVTDWLAVYRDLPK